MSYLEALVRVGANHWVLPRTGGMRTEVHAFLSASLLAATDEALWRQAATAAATPGAVGLYLMPDCHLGYGLPVGGVLVTEDTLVQSGSGYDISCGVVHLRIPGLHAADVASSARRRAWVGAVEDRVATGVGSHRARRAPALPSAAELPDLLRYGAKALGVPASVCERHFVPVDPAVDVTSVAAAYGKAAAQFGSVGGGNHFVELQVDAADGSVWAMVHCGSRGYGWQTANHFFHEGARLRGLPPARREESWLRADEPLGRRYWAHHNSAANYAIANRHRIVEGVSAATEEVFGAKTEVYYEVSHNLVQEETLVLPDGTHTRGFVHRKGATRAFPAGHPELEGTPWAATGHPVLIPGSMRDGAAILFPKGGAYRSACSVNHGAGRVLARGQAKRDLAPLHAAIDHDMQTLTRTFDGVPITGIVGNTARTPLDECGHVYKDLDAVLAVLVDEGIAEVARRLYPVANLKGAD